MKRPLLTLKNRVSNSVGSPVRTWTRGREVDESARERKRFLDSARWEHTRKAKLARDPMCQYCAFEGCITEGHDVDHYVPLAEGGNPTADDNLVTACVSCHSRKTLAERNGTPYPKFTPGNPRVLALA